ncbi:MAG: class I SAM-dependent methyltransferase [Ignavibacteriaceae bacterium]|jgi:ubiquinone/menaquinone biosynthesis C-methylase UbiE
MGNNFCPICGIESFVRVGRPKTNALTSKLVKKDYSIVQCNSCTAYFVDPQIEFTFEEWKTLYENDYFGNQTDWFIRKREKELNERFLRLNQKSKNRIRTFLDVGCGEGNTLSKAQHYGWEAWGVDVADNRSKEAKDKNIQFKRSTLVNANFPADYFDCIYCDSVLEHVLNPVEYLKEIHRILKKGGVVYIGVPNEESFFNDIKKIMFYFLQKKQIAAQLKPFDSPYHIVGFTKKSFTYTIKENKFKMLEFRNFGRKFEFLGFKPNTRGFWISLVLLPVEFIGKLLSRDVYFDAILTKYNY